MTAKYDHNKIEKKWQKYWLKNKTFKADIDHSKPKYYVLDMFPYPSGAGLHVGHVEDIPRQILSPGIKGKEDLMSCIPWDGIALACLQSNMPSAQAPILRSPHRKISTTSAVSCAPWALATIGTANLPQAILTYYKWTQWIFTKLYEKGLAYEAEMLVNYCPALGTVLANEEVENGDSKEGGHPVERRPCANGS